MILLETISLATIIPSSLPVCVPTALDRQLLLPQGGASSDDGSVFGDGWGGAPEYSRPGSDGEMRRASPSTIKAAERFGKAARPHGGTPEQRAKNRAIAHWFRHDGHRPPYDETPNVWVVQSGSAIMFPDLTRNVK